MLLRVSSEFCVTPYFTLYMAVSLFMHVDNYTGIGNW